VSTGVALGGGVGTGSVLTVIGGGAAAARKPARAEVKIPACDEPLGVPGLAADPLVAGALPAVGPPALALAEGEPLRATVFRGCRRIAMTRTMLPVTTSAMTPEPTATAHAGMRLLRVTLDVPRKSAGCGWAVAVRLAGGGVYGDAGGAYPPYPPAG
jgi:hypothetical protein